MVEMCLVAIGEGPVILSLLQKNVFVPKCTWAERGDLH